MRTRFLPLMILLVVGALFAVATVVFAHHKEFSGSASKKANISGYENYIMSNWALRGTDVVWKSDALIRNDVVKAIGNWKKHSGISSLGWTEGSDWNVRFEHKDCGRHVNGDSIPAFIESPTEDYWEPLVGHGNSLAANYLKKADICISNTVRFQNSSSMIPIIHNARLAAITHEIGHVYGLAERYNEYTGQCGSDKSIMDGGRDWSVVILHCDGIDEPQTIDVERVTRLYSKGSLSGLTATTTSHEELSNGKATGATISWEDAAWAEKEHRIKFYIYESTGWRHFTTETIEEGIGTHRDIRGVSANVSPKPYELSYDFSPQEFSYNTQDNERLPDVADYRFCGTPYFKPFNKEGTINCSSGSVELVNPRGKLSASTTTVSVRNTIEVNLTNLYPDNLADFSVKVSGSISSGDECKPGDERLDAARRIGITGCSVADPDADGKVTLLSKPHAETLAELTIEVESSSQTITPASPLKRYDANGNGKIDIAEAIAAVRNYFDGKITIEVAIRVVQLYFSALSGS